MYHRFWLARNFCRASRRSCFCSSSRNRVSRAISRNLSASRRSNSAKTFALAEAALRDTAQRSRILCTGCSPGGALNFSDILRLVASAAWALAADSSTDTNAATNAICIISGFLDFRKGISTACCSDCPSRSGFFFTLSSRASSSGIFANWKRHAVVSRVPTCFEISSQFSPCSSIPSNRSTVSCSDHPFCPSEELESRKSLDDVAPAFRKKSRSAPTDHSESTASNASLSAHLETSQMRSTLYK
mmetsp:Transcript_2904/g.13579  ORF Transcript_2904/g.13579 Transcript_2904/m.13579 type:complete len:245 (+) Transcript_2904:2854-3588(+)